MPQKSLTNAQKKALFRACVRVEATSNRTAKALRFIFYTS